MSGWFCLPHSQSSYSYLPSMAITVSCAWTLQFPFPLCAPKFILKNFTGHKAAFAIFPYSSMCPEFYFYTSSCSNASLYHIASLVMGVRDSRAFGKVKSCFPVASFGGSQQCHHYSWEALHSRPEVSAPAKSCGPEQVILLFRLVSWIFSFWPGLLGVLKTSQSCEEDVYKYLWVLVIF